MTTPPPFRRRLSGVPTLLAALLAAATAAAQEPATPGAPPAGATLETFQNWTLSCLPREGAADACSILQDQPGEDGERRMATEIRLERDGGATAILLLPFGLSLDEGVSARIGEDPPAAEAPFLTCLPNGCVATFPLGPALLDRMRAGTVMTVDLATVAGEPLAYEVSLLGLTAALDRLSAETAG